ncbi:5-oxoprolinase subunit PxpB [Microbulbifer harenosus]|uniref:5-oxoprolinase subunit PxpB n=1 Tax=Microbulbifer harenosus TaxID=2576840 RepID=A0ABY2UEA3_9GAMM|nr:5-oxoprolinase subunit PxpB [Microbulbifer harenosus]TLM74854.1 5-oxoprolinase subunit PxpB [Microbulbifer harenosus]
MSLSFQLIQNGDSALDICFQGTPGEALSKVIIALQRLLQQEMALGCWPGLQELIPAYQCLTIVYDPVQITGGGPTFGELHAQLQAFIAKTLASSSFPEALLRTQPSALIEIPVCYAEPFAIDMDVVCAHTGLARNEVIARHHKPEYLVHMLGFSPGFLYLGGLDPSISCPRKEKPALRVDAGSVGIGGAQTGIYPQATPGGWQIIGRTPLPLFDPQQEYPFVARPLDRIRFVPISVQEFESMTRNAAVAMHAGSEEI